MMYIIEYDNSKRCNYANGRADLLDWLQLLKDEDITDIGKVYKSGVTDSVLEKYHDYIAKTKRKAELSRPLCVCIDF